MSDRGIEWPINENKTLRAKEKDTASVVRLRNVFNISGGTTASPKSVK